MFALSQNRKTKSIKLGLESLNSRIVPAVLLMQLDLDGDGATDDIRIIGDAQHSKITISDNGANSVQVQIDANGDGDFTDVGLGDKNTSFNFQGDSFLLEARLGAGNDTLTYTTTGNYSASARTLLVDLGAGSDTFTYNTGANNTLNSSRIALDVTGGVHNDTIDISFNEVRKSLISVKVDSGLGNDKYDLSFDRIDDTAAVDIHTELGAGLNVHTADFQEIGYGDKASVDMVVVGGIHTDLVELRMLDDIGNGIHASRFSAVVDLLAGADSFKALLDLGGNTFRVDDHSQASFVVRGGAGNDTISAGLNGAGGIIRLDDDSLLSLDFDGGLGNDTISTNFGLADAFETIGTMRIRMDGGLGIDTMACLLANNLSTTGTYDVAVRGGAGNDNMTFNFINNGGTPTFGPAGGIILDGGLGYDTVTNSNPAVTKSVGLEVMI